MLVREGVSSYWSGADGGTGVPQTVAVKNCKDEYGTYISYKTLKMLYEDHLSVATILKDA